MFATFNYYYYIHDSVKIKWQVVGLKCVSWVDVCAFKDFRVKNLNPKTAFGTVAVTASGSFKAK